jgi:hypothetical protein
VVYARSGGALDRHALPGTTLRRLRWFPAVQQLEGQALCQRTSEYRKITRPFPPTTAPEVSPHTPRRTPWQGVRGQPAGCLKRRCEREEARTGRVARDGPPARLGGGWRGLMQTLSAVELPAGGTDSRDVSCERDGYKSACRAGGAATEATGTHACGCAHATTIQDAADGQPPSCRGYCTPLVCQPFCDDPGTLPHPCVTMIGQAGSGAATSGEAGGLSSPPAWRYAGVHAGCFRPYGHPPHGAPWRAVRFPDHRGHSCRNGAPGSWGVRNSGCACK